MWCSRLSQPKRFPTLVLPAQAGNLVTPVVTEEEAQCVANEEVCSWHRSLARRSILMARATVQWSVSGCTLERTHLLRFRIELNETGAGGHCHSNEYLGPDILLQVVNFAAGSRWFTIPKDASTRSSMQRVFI